MKTKIQPSYLYVPFDTVERKDDGCWVSGYAFCNETVPGEGGIRILRRAMEDATPEYMRGGTGPLREMHQRVAAGIATEAIWDEKGCRIRAKVVDPTARLKCEEGVYRGFSIGVQPTVMRAKDVESLTWVETSLVDRPKDPDAVFNAFRVDGFEPGVAAEVEVTAPIEEQGGAFILRLGPEPGTSYATRELAEAAFARGIATTTPALPMRENLEGAPKCPHCGAAMICRGCSGKKEYAAEPPITRIIREEAGKFYVYSHDGAKKLGGPYESKAEAEERLREIEYFKAKDRVERAALPEILAIEEERFTLLTRNQELSADLVRVQGELKVHVDALGIAKEQIARLEAMPATVAPYRTDTGHAPERTFAANQTGGRLETAARTKVVLERLNELKPMRPVEIEEQRRVASEIMALTNELYVLQSFG